MARRNSGDYAVVWPRSAKAVEIKPVVTKPEHIMIAVSGDPLRSNCYLFVHNGMLGFPTTKSVKLPKGWRMKLSEAQG